ncbi:MAG TPA: zinc-dependent metalloprotease [Chitinophagaceae bacterium]|nr:zinc-dependent metalloprotease [Chitinophagaceae bacterium]
MNNTTRLLFTSLFALGFSLFASAQRPTVTDTSARPTGPGTQRPTTAPRPYKEVITDKAKTDDGFFKVHKVEDKWFFEIPHEMLNRDILTVNRISKAAAGMRSGGFFGYAGDDINRNVIRFEKGPINKIFLRNISFAEYTRDSTSPMFTAVNKSNIQPIAASFDIKAFSKDSTTYVIEMTDYISGDNDVLHFSSSLKSSLRIGAIQADKSYIEGVRSYPINIEITAVKTYGRSASPATTGGGAGGFGAPATPSGNMTVEINSSLVLLPKTPMQPRYYDPRVGFFSMGYTDYDANPQGVKSISMVKRWRLEPKEEDMEKYKRGELVEPKKPIIFYIDPATPEKWVSYLIQGVNDWQVAFEKAGFKNAIFGKRAPAKQEDSTWSLDDARNSAIVYKPSNVANASGPSISDPRSGEIIESHINWYHNVMELLRNWYFVQCSPLDPKARTMVFDNELMGQLIRFVSSHEVGHTLGLQHNFGSSSTVPVENLRNKAWVEANGHTPSIMDYARFNYVAQPEDKISESGLFPRIGDYDKWAIEWGYKLFPQYTDADAEVGHLNNWVIGKLKDKRLWFGSSTQDDPRSQSEQVGDDSMKASMYGIKNLQRIVPNLIEWTKEANEDYSNLNIMYGQVVAQYSRYMGHVTRYVAGVMETPRKVEEAAPVYEIVSEAKQKEAVEFLQKNLFNTPTWLLNNDIFSKTGTNPVSAIGNVQDGMLSRMLSTRNLSKLLDAEAILGNKAYQMTELLADLKKGIWSEVPARKSIDIYRRNLQKSYVNSLINIIKPAAVTSTGTGGGFTISFGPAISTDKSDVKSVVRAHLQQIRSEAKTASAVITDEMSRYHLQDIAARIDSALDLKN